MSDSVHLSIVVPAYNEEKRIHKIAEAAVKYCAAKDFGSEMIVVVDGSEDDTAGAVALFKDRIPDLKVIERKENRGKGRAVKEGVMCAVGRYILFADADNSTPLEQVDRLLLWSDRYEVVIGSRYVREGRLARPQPPVRRWGGRLLNLIVQAIAVPGIRDTQCGFKLFEARAAREMFSRLTLDHWSFDIELLAIARELGYGVKEVGVTWYDDPHSQVRPFTDGLCIVRDARIVRKNALEGKYR